MHGYQNGESSGGNNNKEEKEGTAGEASREHHKKSIGRILEIPIAQKGVLKKEAAKQGKSQSGPKEMTSRVQRGWTHRGTTI